METPITVSTVELNLKLRVYGCGYVYVTQSIAATCLNYLFQ